MPRKPTPAHNLKTTRSGKVKKRSIIWRWRRLLYLGVLALTVGVAGMAYVMSRVELPIDPTVAPEEKQTSFVCSAEVVVSCGASNAMATLHGDQDREVVDYKGIPDVLVDAVVAAEDRTYFEHGGVDPIGIARAAWADIRNEGAKQGGSTITQQYVKQTYLTSDRTLNRKVKEAVMAVKLEQQLSKEEILARYLNTIYFGRGAYGVQAASRAYFNHDLAALSLPEATFLAGLIRSPRAGDPWGTDALGGPIVRTKALERSERLRRVILGFMVQDGAITAKQRRDALKPPIVTTPAEASLVKPRQAASNYGSVAGKEYGTEYFVDYVRRWLHTTGKFSDEEIYGGGLRVYTTLDRTMQKAAYDSITQTLNYPNDPSAAMVSIDETGQVKAMVGGTDFARSQVNLAAGREGGGSGRQPGSTFKTIALAEAVKRGYSIESRYQAPSSITFADVPGVGTWKVRGGAGGARIDLAEATKKSVNTVYAQLMMDLGADKVVDLAKQMGIREQRDGDLDAYPSLVLGAGSVAPMDMASAYSTFANNGVHKSPIVVTRVDRPDGTSVRFTPEQQQILTPEQNARVTSALRQVVEGGTGSDAAFGQPAAGKTGTTQNNTDGWFVGFTPKLTTAVWMGYPQAVKGPDGVARLPVMNNVHGIEVQGGTFPARMWKTYMQQVTRNRPPTDFPAFPPEVIEAGNLLHPELARPATTAPRYTAPQTQRSTPGTSAPATSTPATSTTAPQGGGGGNANGNGNGRGDGDGDGQPGGGGGGGDGNGGGNGD